MLNHLEKNFLFKEKKSTHPYHFYHRYSHQYLKDYYLKGYLRNSFFFFFTQVYETTKKSFFCDKSLVKERKVKIGINIFPCNLYYARSIYVNVYIPYME
jgi:hypothetical protein